MERPVTEGPIESPPRTEPPFDTEGGERLMLKRWLDYHRATLAMKCSGLSADQLRQQSVPPSPLSLAGLLRHMTEVERGWFTKSLAGQEVTPQYYSTENPDGDFLDVEYQDPFEAYEIWVRACDESRSAAAGVDSLDQMAARQADRHSAGSWFT